MTFRTYVRTHAGRNTERRTQERERINTRTHECTKVKHRNAGTHERRTQVRMNAQVRERTNTRSPGRCYATGTHERLEEATPQAKLLISPVRNVNSDGI